MLLQELTKIVKNAQRTKQLKIKLSDFPREYGKPSAALQKAIEFLNTKNLNDIEYFDFPDYAGLPKSVSNKLSTDEVDFLQTEIESRRKS
jgi:hypothetical protein